MQVVDAVQIHVFCMPRKQSLPHSEVQVGCVDSFNSDTQLFVDGVQYSTKPVWIPDILVFVVDRARDIGTVDWTVEGNILPEFTLKVAEVRVRWSFIAAVNRIKCIATTNGKFRQCKANIRSVTNAFIPYCQWIQLAEFSSRQQRRSVQFRKMNSIAPWRAHTLVKNF